MYRVTNVFSYIATFIVLFFILILLIIKRISGNPRFLERQIKAMARSIPLLFGIKVDTSRLELPEDENGRIYMANHVNIFDPFIIFGHIPHFIRGVELESHFKWPVWGAVTRLLGNIPISHKNPAAAMRSLKVAEVALNSGTSIGILPEGHRTRDGKTAFFHKGGFRLAKSTGADIVPLAMTGLWELKSVHTPFVKPGTVQLVSAEPINASSFKDKTVNELKEQVFGIITGMTGENSKQ